MRYPLAPLVRLDDTTHADLARRVGVNRRHVQRVALTGLTRDLADSWAVARGWHPAEVWGDLWWWDPLEDDPGLWARWARLDWRVDADRTLAQEWH